MRPSRWPSTCRGSVDAFVTEMNAAAQALGMQGSAFRNPHGLPARGHYTTAHDLALLAKTIISRVSGFLQPLRRARVQLQRHRPAQSQRAAVARRERRRPENGLHLRRRLLPRHFGCARRHASHRRRSRGAECPLTKRRRAKAARVRLHELRDPQALLGGTSTRQRARLGRRARVRRLGAHRRRVRHDPAR